MIRNTFLLKNLLNALYNNEVTKAKSNSDYLLDCIE